MSSDSQHGDPERPRPRPRYGEMAPEGWSWDPPHSDAALGSNAPPSSPASPPGQWTAPVAGRPGYVTAQRAPAPAWDRAVTIVLIVVGLLGTFFAVSLLAALPQAVQVLYSQEGLGRYTPPASVGGLITGGAITEVAVWLASTIVSILLLARRRRVFYVPLIGAVVSFVVIVIFMSVVLTTDPTLLNYFNRP